MQNLLRMISGWGSFLRRGGNALAEESKIDRVLETLKSMRETSKMVKRTAMLANLP